jgi:Dirigent-like protein
VSYFPAHKRQQERGERCPTTHSASGLLAVLVALFILVLTAGGQDTFTVVVALEEEQEADLGEEGPSVGDLYAFSGPLLDESENTELGRFDGECTTTSSPGPSAEARRLCNVTATFVEEREGAEIEAQGVGRIEAEDVVFAVTGGTGEFRDARGQATFEYEEREDGIVITYEVDE